MGKKGCKLSTSTSAISRPAILGSLRLALVWSIVKAPKLRVMIVGAARMTETQNVHPRIVRRLGALFLREPPHVRSEVIYNKSIPCYQSLCAHQSQ